MTEKAEKVNTPWAQPDNDGKAGPPIETASREELARSGYSLPETRFETEEQTQARLAKAAKGAPENKSLTPDSENKSTVEFASSAAADAATEAKLTDADFAGVKGSGVGGSLTKADVQAVIDSKQS